MKLNKFFINAFIEGNEKWIKNYLKIKANK